MKYPDHREEKLQPLTLNSYMSHYSEILKWGQHEEYKVVDVFSRLRAEDKIASKNKKGPFSVEQLNLILEKEALPYKNEPKQQYKYWVPIVGLLKGLRLGEIVSLQVDDIKKGIGDIDYIAVRITGEEGEEIEKSLKTKTSIRQLPISETLKSLGFMAHVESLREAGVAMLFPNSLYASGKPSKKFTREFRKSLNAHGLKSRKLSFHSLRHTWMDFVRESEVEREVIREIGGWKEGDTMESTTYGSSHSLSTVNKPVFL